MTLNDYEIKHIEYLRNQGGECTLFLKRNSDFPLASACKVALYGSGARKTLKGGTGSGEVNSRFFVNIEDALTAAGFTITSKSWLDSYDKIITTATKAFYKKLKDDAKKQHTLAIYTAMGAIMPEPEYDLPIDGDGDVGIYVLSRISGEGSDRTNKSGDIKLSATEIRDILAVKEKYSKFLLVINAGGVVDLSPVLEVENILVLSQLGVVTSETLCDIILGKQNPSGKLATTWTAWEDYPDFDFGDANDTRYGEGIYVGYRYFDSVKKQAQFPFGFGLSYTDFMVGDNTVSVAGSMVTVTSKVTNTGSVAGKEVVQVYVSIPSGKLDEPYQVLAGFGKSDLLAAGASCEVKVTFDLCDIAPYSESDSAYILETGNYIVRVGNSSTNTTAIAALKLDKEVIVRRVRACTSKPDFKDYIPDVSDAGADSPSNVIKLDVNAFSTIDTTYDIACPIDERVAKLEDDVLMRLVLGAYGLSKGMQSIVGNAGFSVAGAAGQTSLEATNYGIPSMVMADGPAGVRINRRAAVDKNGVVHGLEMGIPESMVCLLPKPAEIMLRLIKYRPKKSDKIIEQYATALPIGTAIAQSFNVDFAEKCGDIVGDEMERFGIHLWLAPALNIHRSIRCGRNFEYYSEDPLISGLMSAAITRGVQSHPGCAVTIKHYCANNQETNRVQSNSVMSERALREIYLKGFGICVNKGNPLAVMTSYNLVNGVHSSESRPLNENILRCEYGFDGIIMTDWVINGFSTDKSSTHPVAHSPNVIMADGDLFMPGCENDFLELKAAFEAGKVTREQLEKSGSRVARMADKLVK